MQIQDIIEFDRKSYFGGAVQANWFYDAHKVKAITESYVFHGSKYHGVNGTTDKKYRLYDTASYAFELMQKINQPDSNRFCMTIAGYGTGKSHLAVALAALLSGHDSNLRESTIRRIAGVDREIAEKIRTYSGKNLVLVYNGMNNFNLDSETLRLSRIALAQHGLDDSVFSEITKQYQQAVIFIEKTFQMLIEDYTAAFSENSSEHLKEYIINHIQEDTVFRKVNGIYKSINGSDIQWEKGISAGDILTLLAEKYCKEQKIFDNIIILFDEFGRYIEYTAANPMIAGESALQQIFEAVQNANGSILFDAFIQSDLNAYLSRIDRTANIVRYVGRYENSDKYYLSSNFETILANLLIKKDAQKFQDIVEYNINTRYALFNDRVYNNLIRWTKKAKGKSVWCDRNLYDTVIVKGCYPLHPLTVWFLSNTSDWMQQRSTIAFTEKMFESVKEQEINNQWIKYIYAVDIIDSELFDEMLNSETKGLVQSQNCMLYHEVIRKYGDKLNEKELSVLKAILIINLCRFDIFDRADCLSAIRYCTSLKEEEVTAAVISLENNHGVISFDDRVQRFDFLEEAVGQYDYKKIVSRKVPLFAKYNGVIECDDTLANELKLNTPEETSFAQEHQVYSCEWRFEKRLIASSEVNSMRFTNWCHAVDNAVDGESARGLIVYIYCGKNSKNDIAHICKLYQQYHLSQKAIILQLLIDPDNDLLDLLRTRKTINSLSAAEKERFSKFITPSLKNVTKNIIRKAEELINARNYISDKGLFKSNERIRTMCLNRFKEVYPNVVPFAFDGFERKPTPQAKKSLLELCTKMYEGSMTNQQMYQSFAPPLKNRIQAVLLTNIPTSWQVFDSRCRLCEPQNASVKKVYQDAKKKLHTDEIIGIGAVFNSYLKAPYGMNKYSLALFIMYFICYHHKIQIFRGTEALKKSEFSQLVFQNDKKMTEILPTFKIMLREKTDTSQMEELCRTITENRSPEYCSKLLSQLERVKSDSDSYEQYQDKIAAAELYAKEGKKLYARIYTNTLIPAEQTLTDIKKAFSLLKAVSILKSISRCTFGDLIDEDSDYQYSTEYCERINNLLRETSELINKHFNAYLKEMVCSSSNISEFRKKHKAAANILSKAGKKDKAELLLEKVETVITETEMRQKYEASLGEIDRDTAMIDDIFSLKYSTGTEVLSKLYAWQKFIENASDLSKNIIKTYSDKLEKAIERVKKHQEELLASAEELLNHINHVSSETDLNALKSSIIKIQGFVLPDEYQNTFENVVNDIDSFLQKKKTVTADSSLLGKLKMEYHEVWKSTVCSAACLELIRQTENKIASERQSWVNKNIIAVMNHVDSMTAEICIAWKNANRNHPTYLTEEDICLLEELNQKLDNRLKSLRIQGVVSMFCNLSAEEKEECIKILLYKNKSE